MKLLALLAVGVGFVLSVHSATAQNGTGVQLLEECQLVATTSSPDMIESDVPKALHCLGYLGGVSDTFRYWDYQNETEKGNLTPLACIPNGVTQFELAKVVVKYLNDHPTRLHEKYGVAVFLAFADAYPCKK